MITGLLVGVLILQVSCLVLFWSRKHAPGDSGERLTALLRTELRESREEASRGALQLREELSSAQARTLESLLAAVETMNSALEGRLSGFAQSLRKFEDSGSQRLTDLRTTLDKGLLELQERNQEKLERVRSTTEAQLKELRESLDRQLQELRKSNEEKLERMRHTVDEKLQSTLEKRLGESFRMVGQHLEAVQRGLGEMQSLASGVGDLKRVLSNVKARGTWGEVQLGAILEQILIPEQYSRNVQTRPGSRETVEFAVRLPGRGSVDSPVWLPIDSKFPQESYLQLLDAVEAGNREAVHQAQQALGKAVQNAARDIRDKYLEPPQTTDFAILFLPTEGLYAEILRQSGRLEDLLQTYRVVVAGPSTLAAILSSLRLGFHTLAIEKRSSEVWEILRAVKTEFGKFGEILAKVERQLSAAGNTIRQTEVRTRAMARKLRSVEEMPPESAGRLLELHPEQGEESSPESNS